METIILVIHLLIGLSLVGVVLMQRSEGGLGGLGGGGGGGGGASGGMGGLLGNRTAANLLTRATALLAALFMVTSISLAILAGGNSDGGSIVNEATGAAQSDGLTPLATLPVIPSVPTTD
jgi:preprotein translocase subunit SecG